MSSDSSKCPTSFVEKQTAPGVISFYSYNSCESYACYGVDAKTVALEVIGSASMIKKIDKVNNATPLQYVTINPTQFDAAVKDLLINRRLTVQVFETSAKNAAPSRPGNEWKLVKTGSKSNSKDFEYILGDDASTDDQILVGILINQSGASINVGVAAVFPNEFRFRLTEFVDNNFFADLESLLIRLCPSECILGGSVTLANELSEMFRLVDLVPKTSRKKSAIGDLVSNLDRLLKFAKGQSRNSSSLPQVELKFATEALAMALEHLGLPADETARGRYHLENLEREGYMRLDLATLSGLNVLPPPGLGIAKETSLYGLLNHCRSSLGEALLSKWLRQPLTDKTLIEERLDMVEALIENSAVLDDFHQDLLRKFPSLNRLAGKLAKCTASLEDCYRLYVAVRRLPDVVKKFEDLSVDQSKMEVFNQRFVQVFGGVLADFAKFLEMVESTIDFELAEQQQFFVKANFDDDLLAIRERMSDLEESAEKELRRTAKNLNLESGKGVKMDQNDQFGFYFRVTKKDEKLLRNNRAYELLSSQKGGVHFTNAGLRSTGEDYLAAKAAYLEQQKRLVSEIVGVAATFLEPLFKLTNALAELDVLVSLAVAALNAPVPYTRPVILDQGSDCIDLKALRHPLVECQENKAFIPNDLILSHSGKKGFHLITGPNMGGKSTYIRSAGLAVLMAQIGSFIPAGEGSKVTICDAVLARVGAADCLMKGLSTFMAEMSEMSSIIRSATSNSLVIVDELGRGTSTFDGLGLAWAISKHLAESVSCFCMFATHFHEMTTLAHEVPNVWNEHVTAMTEDGQFTLLYTVNPGPIDESFGIHIAQMVGLPDSVVQKASTFAQELEGEEGSTKVSKEQIAQFLVKLKKKTNEEKENISDKEWREQAIKELKAMGVEC